MFDIAQLIGLAPNLAFGFAALWLLFQIHKERVAENARYASSLEKILEKALTAIAHNAAISASNGESIARLTADTAAIRADIGKILDGIERLVRDSAKRNTADRSRPQGGAS